MRIRRVLMFGLPAVTLAGLLAFWLLPTRTAITRQNAEKIQKGMTLAEVEDILGGPPRDDGFGLVALRRLDGSECAMPLRRFQPVRLLLRAPRNLTTRDSSALAAAPPSAWRVTRAILTSFEAQRRKLDNRN